MRIVCTLLGCRETKEAALRACEQSRMLPHLLALEDEGMRGPIERGRQSLNDTRQDNPHTILQRGPTASGVAVLLPAPVVFICLSWCTLPATASHFGAAN